MKHFRITEVATSNIVEYDAELPQPEHLADGYIVEDVSDAVVAPVAPPEVYSGSWHITKLAFRSRLTDDEKQDIEVASIDVATATLANRKKAAALRVYMADLAVSEYIDLKDSRLRDGVLKMEQLGLIAAGRAGVILDTIPKAEELFNG